jgi:hypothetical protein
MTIEHCKNEFYISGLLKPGSAAVVEGTKGRFVTKFTLINNQRTSDKLGKILEYPVTVMGNHEKVIQGVGQGRILVSGYLRFGNYGPYCLGDSAEVQPREEFDYNQFEVCGLMASMPRLRSTNTGDLTYFGVQVHRYSGYKKKFDSLDIPVYGNKLTLVNDEIKAHRGDGIRITGRLAVGKTTPYPRGWRIEIESKFMKQMKATGWGKR